MTGQHLRHSLLIVIMQTMDILQDFKQCSTMQHIQFIVLLLLLFFNPHEKRGKKKIIQ